MKKIVEWMRAIAEKIRIMVEWIFDCLVEAIKGRRDDRNSLTFEDREKKAKSHRKQLVAGFNRRVQAAVCRYLTPGRKRQSDLEIRNLYLQQQLEKRRCEIIAWHEQGIMSTPKMVLELEALKGSTELTSEDEGKVIRIGLGETLEICSEVNASNMTLLDYVNSLKARYERKWESYQHALNKSNNTKEVDLLLGIEHIVKDLHSFIEPMSSHMNSKSHEMEMEENNYGVLRSERNVYSAGSGIIFNHGRA
jgi:hypothetical protein